MNMFTQSPFLQTIEPVCLPAEVKRKVVAAHTSRNFKTLEVEGQVSGWEQTESMLITEIYTENNLPRFSKNCNEFQVLLTESTNELEYSHESHSSHQIQVELDGHPYFAKLTVDSFWMWDEWAWQLTVPNLYIAADSGQILGGAIIRGRIFPFHESFRWKSLAYYWNESAFT